MWTKSGNRFQIWDKIYPNYLQNDVAFIPGCLPKWADLVQLFCIPATVQLIFRVIAIRWIEGTCQSYDGVYLYSSGLVTLFVSINRKTCLLWPANQCCCCSYRGCCCINNALCDGSIERSPNSEWLVIKLGCRPHLQCCCCCYGLCQMDRVKWMLHTVALLSVNSARRSHPQEISTSKLPISESLRWRWISRTLACRSHLSRHLFVRTKHHLPFTEQPMNESCCWQIYPSLRTSACIDHLYYLFISFLGLAYTLKSWQVVGEKVMTNSPISKTFFMLSQLFSRNKPLFPTEWALNSGE